MKFSGLFYFAVFCDMVMVTEVTRRYFVYHICELFNMNDNV